jgi:hypothetical protein
MHKFLDFLKLFEENSSFCTLQNKVSYSLRKQKNIRIIKIIKKLEDFWCICSCPYEFNVFLKASQPFF